MIEDLTGCVIETTGGQRGIVLDDRGDMMMVMWDNARWPTMASVPDRRQLWVVDDDDP